MYACMRMGSFSEISHSDSIPRAHGQTSPVQIVEYLPSSFLKLTVALDPPPFRQHLTIFRQPWLPSLSSLTHPQLENETYVLGGKQRDVSTAIHFREVETESQS